jgi:hypothetical protein
LKEKLPNFITILFSEYLQQKKEILTFGAKFVSFSKMPNRKEN